jgi:hypothetical protein
VVSLRIAGHLPDEDEARRVFERTMRGVVEGLLVRKQDVQEKAKKGAQDGA